MLGGYKQLQRCIYYVSTTEQIDEFENKANMKAITGCVTGSQQLSTCAGQTYIDEPRDATRH